MIELSCISLWQPFASLIFAGRKLHETRGWAYARRLEGATIAIHATKAFTPRALISPELDALCVETFGSDYFKTLPRAQVLGVVRLDGCHATAKRGWIGHDDLLCGDWTPGRCAWKLGDVRALRAPFGHRGKQGWGKAVVPNDAQAYRPVAYF